ncbi:ATP-dependent helicase HrpB [Paenarthrobacter sp. NCHU4564]|uniref:ATP-dependent helicase HrpB n=1 Tax=Paenarthrobacter sp. NCHU4564 TaxID=3451353 RepID=UPI003F9ADCF8
MIFGLDTIGEGLAFGAAVDTLSEALQQQGDGGMAVVQAPPGSGKTTLVPPLVANLAAGMRPGRGPRVVVTQPRRVAARSAARRLAALDGSRLGGRVGYTVRGESKAGKDTVVEFVTPGILLRRLLADPGLEDIHAVVLDEVHERGLETDLLLGMVADVSQLRGDLTVVAMSATLDAPRFAALLGQSRYDGGAPVPVVDSPSALHHLEVSWAPASAPRLDERGVTRAFLDHVAGVAASALSALLVDEPAADALVFVPGVREVSGVATALRHTLGSSVDVLELHGQVRPGEQDKAVSGRLPGGLPRIIVSTALAESSLTVPGVRLVIDSGLSREPRRDSSRGMTGLVTVSCSKASADQRAGRAARQGPGKVVRCYDQQAFAAAPDHQTPEIVVSDLAAAALVMACWGTPEGKGLALPDAPPRGAMEDAVEVLRELGAVDSAGAATPLGQTLARIPADPRLARALIDGSAMVDHQAAAETVALVAGDYRAPDSDLTRLLAALRDGKDAAARRFSDDVKRMAGMVRQDAAAVGHHRPKPAVTPRQALGFVVALAFPDRIARRVPGTGSPSYLLTSGTRAGLSAASPLAGQEWLAVSEVARAQGRDAAGTGAVIRAAAPLSLDLAIAAAPELLVEQTTAAFAGGKVTARQERRLGAIVLSSTPVRASAESAREAVARSLSSAGLSLIGWSEAAETLRRRLALLHRTVGEPWPDVSEDALLVRVDEWLGPELEALAAGKPARGIDLADPLRRLLPWPEASRLDSLAPERLEVPSGSRIRIDYPPVSGTGAGNHDAGRPVVAVKLQECFGWDRTPRLADGRVPVLFHLLSPAGRPLAITDDLASFWSGPYAQVRAEMRGRYPKHPWPEDPWTAPATARTRNRM